MKHPCRTRLCQEPKTDPCCSKRHQTTLLYLKIQAIRGNEIFDHQNGVHIELESITQEMVRGIEDFKQELTSREDSKPEEAPKLHQDKAFAKTPNTHHLQQLHIFRCPVYVLHPKLQDGKRIPKWERLSQRSIYLCVSRLHSSTVLLVLDPETGKISPQYHVVFDGSSPKEHSHWQFGTLF